MSSYASTGPFESIFAEGSVYRSAAERPKKLIVVLGIWLIFGPITAGGILVACLSLSGGNDGQRMMGILISVALIAVPGTMLWKTTRNYLARKKTDEIHDA